jgi:hypothetical protein
MAAPARAARCLVLLLVVGGGSLAEAAAPRAPSLVFEGPRELDGQIAELRWIQTPAVTAVAEWLELPEPGPPLRIVLAPEGGSLARSTPRWVSGYARGETGTAVLFPARVVRYPYDDLAELFLHEVTHLLAHRAAGGREIPRWFAEGIALHAARGWTLADRRQALAAGLGGGPGTLGELEAAFGGSSGQVARAYSLAGFLVDELIEEEGPGVVATILSEMRSGGTFEAAFRGATGRGVGAWSDGVWRRYRIWYRWVPFLTSGATLWLLVTALVLIAGVRRRQRDAAIRARWDEEEARLRAPAPRPASPEDPETREDSEEWIH